jgi:hypothetical protein
MQTSLVPPSGLQRPIHPARSRAPSSSSRRSLVVTAAQRGLEYTPFEANAFKLKFGVTGATILVDPWLVDDLTFGGQTWLFRGKKRVKVDFAEASACDLLLLTQVCVV